MRALEVLVVVHRVETGGRVGSLGLAARPMRNLTLEAHVGDLVVEVKILGVRPHVNDDECHAVLEGELRNEAI